MPRGVAKKNPNKAYVQVKVDKQLYEVLQALLLLSHKSLDETLDSLIDEFIQKKGKEYLQLDKLKNQDKPQDTTVDEEEADSEKDSVGAEEEEPIISVKTQGKKK
jgi:hypothetical protein